MGVSRDSISCGNEATAEAEDRRAEQQMRDLWKLFMDVRDVVPDHREPRGMGASWRDDHPDNIQAAHRRCNQEKGSKRIPGETQSYGSEPRNSPAGESESNG